MFYRPRIGVRLWRGVSVSFSPIPSESDKRQQEARKAGMAAYKQHKRDAKRQAKLDKIARMEAYIARSRGKTVDPNPLTDDPE